MVQKIALAQHFGIPTPLLDWSHSPYVAAYFAVADPRLEENSDVTFSIYALNASSFPATHPHESEEESLRDSIDLCQFIDTSAFFSRRIARQMGCFTYQTFPGCLREWLSTRSEISVPFRIYSVSGSRWQILRELELMGIVGGNLFDDMDHLARDVIMSELMNSQKC